MIEKENISIKDGGPAFPRKRSVHPMHAIGNPADYREDPPQDGMTLRDWFAGHAMSEALREYLVDEIGDEQALKVAKVAWLLADAMIAEREKGKS